MQILESIVPSSAPAPRPQMHESIQPHACERGLDFVFGPERDDISRLHVGLSSTEDFAHLVPLYRVLELHLDGRSLPEGTAPALEAFLRRLPERLGYALGLERFTAMLTLRLLGSSPLLDGALLRQIVAAVRGAFLAPGVPRANFFKPLSIAAGDIAADADGTSVAAAGLLAATRHRIDATAEPRAASPERSSAAPLRALDVGELRRLALELLSAASVADVSAEDNAVRGKPGNGPLERHVFRVYFEDSRFEALQVDAQPDPRRKARFRGLKIDAAACANVLVPVLAALELGELHLDEEVALEEIYVPDPAAPERRAVRRSRATVGEIVRANLAHVVAHAADPERLAKGTYYYPDAATFLCFAAHASGPSRLALCGGARDLLRRRCADALSRSGSLAAPLSLAQIVIAGELLGASPEALAGARGRLVAAQRPNGSWAAGPLYVFGTRRSVFFGSEEVTTIHCVRALEDRGARGAP